MYHLVAEKDLNPVELVANHSYSSERVWRVIRGCGYLSSAVPVASSANVEFLFAASASVDVDISQSSAVSPARTDRGESHSAREADSGCVV